MPLIHRPAAVIYTVAPVLTVILLLLGMVIVRAELMSPGIQYLCADGARVAPSDQAGNCPSRLAALSTLMTGGHVTALSLLLVTLPVLTGGLGHTVVPVQLARPLPWPRMQTAGRLFYIIGIALITGVAAAGGSDTVLTTGLIMVTAANMTIAVILILVCLKAERTPPLFSWGVVALTAFSLPTAPVLAGILVTGLTDRTTETTFFDPTKDHALLYHHLVWVLGSAHIYLVILPALGVIALLASGALRHHRGYRALVVMALVAATLLGAVLGLDQFFTVGFGSL